MLHTYFVRAHVGTYNTIPRIVLYALVFQGQVLEAEPVASH